MTNYAELVKRVAITMYNKIIFDFGPQNYAITAALFKGSISNFS